MDRLSGFFLIMNLVAGIVVRMEQFYTILLLALLWLLLRTPMPAAASCGDQAARELELLAKAYPRLEGELICRNDGAVIFQPAGKNAALLLISPSENEEKPASPSLRAVLAQPYPLGSGHRYPDKGFAPGRLRSLPLLSALYGHSEQQVRANCGRIDFFGTELLFNRRHGALEALRRVIARLATHLALHPEDLAYILPCGGSLCRRTVKDTGLLSAHAFGIALDLNPKTGPYWLWNPSPQAIEKARQSYPQGIVDAFEAEGFIWGGKWDAFDFMHFEYRPECVFAHK